VNQKQGTILAVFNVSCHARRRRAAFSMKLMSFCFLTRADILFLTMSGMYFFNGQSLI